MIPTLVTGTVVALSLDLADPRLPRTDVTLQTEAGETVQVVLPGANGG